MARCSLGNGPFVLRPRGCPPRPFSAKSALWLAARVPRMPPSSPHGPLSPPAKHSVSFVWLAHNHFWSSTVGRLLSPRVSVTLPPPILAVSSPSGVFGSTGCIPLNPQRHRSYTENPTNPQPINPQHYKPETL